MQFVPICFCWKYIGKCWKILDFKISKYSLVFNLHDEYSSQCIWNIKLLFEYLPYIYIINFCYFLLLEQLFTYKLSASELGVDVELYYANIPSILSHIMSFIIIIFYLFSAEQIVHLLVFWFVCWGMNKKKLWKRMFMASITKSKLKVTVCSFFCIEYHRITCALLNEKLYFKCNFVLLF